jgi:hypothetical protein
LCPVAASEKVDGPPPPKDPRYAPSRVSGSSRSCRNAKSARPPSIHHHQPTWLLAMSGAAHPPSAQAHCARSSPRKLAHALPRRAKDMQLCSNDRVPAASRHLSANADSTVFLLGFRRSYLFTATLHHDHRLRQRSILAGMPMSCVVSSLLHDHRLSHFVWNWGEDTPPSHRCATSTTM